MKTYDTDCKMAGTQTTSGSGQTIIYVQYVHWWEIVRLRRSEWKLLDTLYKYFRRHFKWYPSERFHSNPRNTPVFLPVWLFSLLVWTRSHCSLLEHNKRQEWNGRPPLTQKSTQSPGDGDQIIRSWSLMLHHGKRWVTLICNTKVGRAM